MKREKLNIYLDVNGVLLNHDLTPAEGVHDFIKRCFDTGEVYWLTTHCKGDAQRIVEYLKRFFPVETVKLIEDIKSTNWDILKTEAIDFTKDFLWFDDNLFDSERKVLEGHNCLNKYIQVDLRNNPLQLTNLF